MRLGVEVCGAAVLSQVALLDLGAAHDWADVLDRYSRAPGKEELHRWLRLRSVSEQSNSARHSDSA